MLNTDQSLTHGVGTMHYMAPEAMDPSMFYLHKSATSVQSPTRYAIEPIPSRQSTGMLQPPHGTHVFEQAACVHCSIDNICCPVGPPAGYLCCSLVTSLRRSGDAVTYGAWRRDSQRMYATRADVFSFAVLLAAVFNREAPYTTLQSAEILFGVISGTLRPPLPPCLSDSVRTAPLDLHPLRVQRRVLVTVFCIVQCVGVFDLSVRVCRVCTGCCGLFVA
jgi:hypothetical protein